MAVPQITIRLAPNVKLEFDEYASSLGLDASELARLLVVRESRQKRLFKLVSTGQAPAKPQRQSGARKLTVTAHMPSVADVTKFDRYAHSCQSNRNGVGAWLLEAELKERWLENAIRFA